MAELKHNPVIWFEIPVNDMPKAKAFYEYVLGLKIDEHRMDNLNMGLFPMIEEGHGSGGALVQGPGFQPCSRGTLVYFSTPDIEAALARANEKGGRTSLAKQSIGEFGFIGIFEDTEGNRVGLHCMN